jgi:hypothetical protein
MILQSVVLLTRWRGVLYSLRVPVDPPVSSEDMIYAATSEPGRQCEWRLDESLASFADLYANVRETVA